MTQPNENETSDVEFPDGVESVAGIISSGTLSQGIDEKLYPSRTESVIERLEHLDREATAGPWAAQSPHPDGVVGVTLQDGLLVAAFRYSDNPRITQKQAESNARLTTAMRSALPALLAVVEEVKQYLRECDNESRRGDDYHRPIFAARDKMRAALAELEKEAKG